LARPKHNRDQFACHVACRRLGQIESDAPLVAVQADKGRTFAGEIGMFIAPRIVAAVRILNLDHLGAKIGECLRAGRASHNPGEIHDKQTFEGARHALRSRHTIR
jgi:hypothetical protein